MVPEQVRGRRGRAHHQRPPAPELQEEEAAAAAVAEVQLVQGAVVGPMRWTWPISGSDDGGDGGSDLPLRRFLTTQRKTMMISTPAAAST